MFLTDYHCHMLPAIEDGAASLEESLLMALLLVDAGFGRVYCTPSSPTPQRCDWHASPYDTDRQSVDPSPRT